MTNRSYASIIFIALSSLIKNLMENGYEWDYLTVRLTNKTWWFSYDVIDAFEDIGIHGHQGLRSFMVKVLSKKIVPDSEIILLVKGLDLKIKEMDYDIFVDILDRDPF